MRAANDQEIIRSIHIEALRSFGHPQHIHEAYDVGFARDRFSYLSAEEQLACPDHLDRQPGLLGPTRQADLAFSGGERACGRPQLPALPSFAVPPVRTLALRLPPHGGGHIVIQSCSIIETMRYRERHGDIYPWAS